MTTKEKPLDPCQGEAAQEKRHQQYSATNDLLGGWLSLSANSKESRNNRRQKRGWKRGRK